MREFPHLVQLHRKYLDQVACFSLNVNYDGSAEAPPESLREPVQKFLNEQQATFQNILSSEPDTQLYDRLDLASIPAVFVYDRDGKLRKRFDSESGEFDPQGFRYDQHVVPLVEQLLQEKED